MSGRTDRGVFGRAIWTYRKVKGLTQQQLGQILGVSKTTISSWERGEIVPDKRVMEYAERTLGPEFVRYEVNDTDIVTLRRDTVLRRMPDLLDLSNKYYVGITTIERLTGRRVLAAKTESEEEHDVLCMVVADVMARYRGLVESAFLAGVIGEAKVAELLMVTVNEAKHMCADWIDGKEVTDD